MPEKQIVMHCAPTLAGLKTASLFNVTYESKDQLMEDIRDLNLRFRGKGLTFIVIGFVKDKALIYLFRPNRLRSDFRDSGLQEILKEKGYHPENLGECICTLQKKLKEEKAFPHEIGCFLGYPSEDVGHFIHNDAPVLCVGTWKVYSHEAEAKKTFELYKKCTETYMQSYDKGLSLERLAAAV